MISLIISSTVCKRFKIRCSHCHSESVHQTSLRILNLCIGYLLTTVLILRFIISLIVCRLYMNFIILVLCSAFDQILIPFVLLLLAHALLLPYFNKKSHGFRSFLNAAPHLWNYLPNNIRTAPTYMSFRKNLKTYLFNQAFPN